MWTILAAAIATATAAPLAASPRPDYAFTAWTAETGLPPGDVLAMTEDRAGYLWLGTTAGLVRFDGLQFVSWTHEREALPGSVVPAVVGASDGTLWAGFGDVGGVVRIRGGRIVKYYGEKDGLAKCLVGAMLEDRHGTLWAGCQRGLAMLQGSRWQFVGDEHGLPAGDVTSLYEDRHGTLWVATATGIFKRPADSDRFVRVDSSLTYVQSLTEDGAGTLWASDSQAIVKRLDGVEPPRPSADVRLPSAGWRLLHDEHGAVWIAGLGGGLLRLDRSTPRGLVERIRYESRLNGSPRSLFQDHENNIWVGMRGGGLLRLTETVIDTGVALAGLTNDGVRALASAPDGSVWVATGHSLNRFAGATRTVYSLPQTLALHIDGRGGLWVATAQSIGRFADGRFVPLPIAPSVRVERAASMTTDAGGRLWVCMLEQGVVTMRGEALVPLDAPADVAGRGCSYAYTDSHGRVWLGFTRGGAAYDENGRFRVFGLADGLAAGGVLAIVEDPAGAIWISTSEGVSRFANGRFTRVAAADALPGRPAVALTADGDGSLWFSVNGGSGVARVSLRDLDRTLSDRTRPSLQYSLYDASDGLQGATHWAARPSMVRDRAGRLWFVTGNGVALADPRRLPPVRRPSLPRVERVTIGNRSVDPSDVTTLPYASSVAISYSSISLAAASKVRFRYMLEGLSNDWVDAGAGRVASFTNLPAGRYRFRVSATTDGVWSEGEAGWGFSVPPPFYQTTGFYALLTALTALAVWAYWMLRLRAIRKQFSLIVAERTRVSREIHDTLLQSLGAVGVELEIVASQLHPSEVPARDTLKRLRREVGRCIREARQSIWELRSSRLEARDLLSALRELADDVGNARAVHVDVAVVGRPRSCAPETEEQLLRIAQEAIGNAIRHGHARQVRITLEYRRDALSLRVCDDGCGFVPREQESSSGEHWGLTNMRERAERVGGQLIIASHPGEGTLVETVVPTASAA